MTKKAEKKPTKTTKTTKKAVNYKELYELAVKRAHTSDIYAARTIHDLLDSLLELYDMIESANPGETSLLKTVAGKKRALHETMHEMVCKLLETIDDIDEGE